MKAFYIDAGEHEYVADSEDGWSRYETGWYGNVVYAETAAKAKHLFIKEHYQEIGFEYTDKMSIRVLANEADEKWTPHIADAYDDEISDWMRGNRTKFGEERYQQWLKDQAMLEQLEHEWQADTDSAVSSPPSAG